MLSRIRKSGLNWGATAFDENHPRQIACKLLRQIICKVTEWRLGGQGIAGHKGRYVVLKWTECFALTSRWYFNYDLAIWHRKRKMLK